jgi:succinate dehydrogenase/fumarate reductase flavoprotein subunit
MMLPIDELSCDVLILGAGGAGMLAALHVTSANPAARIVIAVKGLIGQSGCTRMVQGGYNSLCLAYRPRALRAAYRSSAASSKSCVT